MAWLVVKWQAEAPSLLGGVAAPRFVGDWLWCACLSTRGQTDMRGLATAGRAFGWSLVACLSTGVTTLFCGGWLLIVRARVAPSRCSPQPGVLDESVGVLVHELIPWLILGLFHDGQ